MPILSLYYLSLPISDSNAPQRKDLMDVIKEACDRGIVVVTISQCSRGSVSAAYAAGRSLANIGVVAGADMTPEVHFALS